MSVRLEALLGRFSKTRVLVVGDLVADEYLYGQTERVSREAPVLVVRFERSEVRAGGAANVAMNARSLGAQVRVVGFLGQDASGRALAEAFRSAGVDARLARSSSVHTETKTRVLAGGINTMRQQVVRIDRTARLPLPRSVERAVCRAVDEALGWADVVVLSDYGGGVASDALRVLLLEAAGRGVQVCVDSRYALASWAGATVCKPNEPELAALTGLPVEDDAQVERAGRQALDLLRCQTLVVTRGRRGMAVFQPRKSPVFLNVFGGTEVVDVTGAGDTVSAALAAALGAGGTARDAAQVANAAGAVVVQKPGTATASALELRAALKRGRVP